jgi:hypothetical protein
MIVGAALEYRHVTENPAAGRRRRLKLPATRPVRLDSVVSRDIIAGKFGLL